MSAIMSVRMECDLCRCSTSTGLATEEEARKYAMETLNWSRWKHQDGRRLDLCYRCTCEVESIKLERDSCTTDE